MERLPGWACGMMVYGDNGAWFVTLKIAKGKWISNQDGRFGSKHPNMFRLWKRKGFGMKIVVFSDLDATLLDAETYSWRDAEKAIDALKTGRLQSSWSQVRPSLKSSHSMMNFALAILLFLKTVVALPPIRGHPCVNISSLCDRRSMGFIRKASWFFPWA